MKLAIKPLERSDLGLPEQIVDKIRELLIENGVSAGDRLGAKEEMRQRFEVSHGVMNQALSILETQGIVELRRGANGGIFVADSAIKMIRLSQFHLSLRQSTVGIEELLEIRNALEPRIVVAAAKAMVDSKKMRSIEKLRRLILQMQASDPGSLAAVRLNWNLHRVISDMGNTAILGLLYRTILDAIEEDVIDSAPADTAEHYKKVIDMHKEIVEAIASGDVAAASRAVARHPLPPSTPGTGRGV